MDTLPLPPRPDLEQYKKRAKELLAATESTDPGAIRAWATECLATLARLLGVEITPFVQGSFDRAVETLEARVREKLARSGAARAPFQLTDAQYLIARAHGFESWSEFASHVRGFSSDDPAVLEFESAAEAVVHGDLGLLRALIRRNPDLLRARSAREHRATLLHYVAANGVEDFRQLSPPNAVAIAKFLLESGAEVDALANTYGGGKAQTTMNLLVSSTHPAEAGVQVALVDTLLDAGAVIDGLEDDGSPLMTALAFGYGSAAEALARRGARVDNLIAAAALGDVDGVDRFLAGGGIDASLVRLYWLGLTNDPKSHVERALVWGAAYGRTAVVERLLARGVDLAAKDPHGMTALHWAAGNGYLAIVKILLRHGAPLEIKNESDQTVLDSTVIFAQQYLTYFEHYSAVIEALIAAGADVHAVKHPPGSGPVGELLKRHGARAAE